MTGGDAPPRPRVFSIPVGAPFLETLADALLAGTLTGSTDASDLADATLFLPTRRAAQAFGAIIARRAPGGALLLPRIVLLGDPEPDEAPGAGLSAAAGSADLPPAIDPLVRRLKLFDLVDAWRRAVEDGRRPHGEAEPFYVARSRADAFALAGELAGLIDETIIEDVPLARLAAGMPEEFDAARHDAYWSLTAKFLEIAAREWPAILGELGQVDAEQRTRTLLLRHAGALAEAGYDRPVIIAGSTGSVSATAELMAAVARLPRGAVVLPGLDMDLDAESWAAVGAVDSALASRFAHPQATLKRTLARIGVTRQAVMRLARAPADGRARLVSEVFRPAETSEGWNVLEPGPAPDGLALVEAADSGEEALAIALILREVLETPGRTAALVTPDRMLARAVQGELERWDTRVADSAGLRLSEAPVGVLARLVLEAAKDDAGGVALLTLLRHPLLAATRTDEAAIDAIELAALRGARWEGRLEELPAALRRMADEGSDRHDPAARRRLTGAQMDRAVALCDRVISALASLRQAFAGGAARLGAAARAHGEAVLALTGTDPEQLSATFEPLLALFDDVAQAGAGPALPFDDYMAIFADLAGAVVLPPAEASHPQIHIWGLLEARLLDADRIVLGGLNEGVWPPDARADPFLNRPMRLALGLQPPERRIGQSAHDFQMLLGHRDVVLTRARKREGAPAVASRFWRRLTACLGETASKDLEGRGQRYLDWARALDRPATVTPALRPAPRIDAGLMPDRINLTEVETLYRDPYALYARRVLKLDPLEPLDPPLDGRERGTLMHDILAQYGRIHAEHLPQDPAGTLTAFGRQAFAHILSRDPAAAHFWWRRFEAFVPWFIGWDADRRQGLLRLHVEQPGRQRIALATGATVTLSTRADRIEERAEGLAIIDFKTGAPPSGTQVRRGLAPQLPLTAALAARGAFADVAATPAETLAYVRVAQAGGLGSLVPIKPDATETVAMLAERQYLDLQTALAEFSAGTRAFLSRRMPEKSSYTGDFDLLARFLEWSLGGGEDSDAEAPE